jgi:hypothetical protein
MEKYQELYSLSKEVLLEEINRYRSLDGKATKYLTALTILLGIIGLFIAKLLPYIFPPHDIYDWLFLILLVLILSFVVISWFLLLKVLRTASLAVTPLSIEFFDKNKLIDIYYALSKTNHCALKRNRKVNNDKSRFLNYGYHTIRLSMVFLVIFFVSFPFYVYACKGQIWKYSNICNTRSIPMNEEQSKEPKPEGTQSQQEGTPDPNVEPLPPDIVTEGAKPPVEKRGKKD